jgi:alpha-glucan,water dikinase
MEPTLTITDDLGIEYSIEFREESNVVSIQAILREPEPVEPVPSATETVATEESKKEADSAEDVKAPEPVEPDTIWLHWGVGVQNFGEWISPNRTELALEYPIDLTTQWDDKASQTILAPNAKPTQFVFDKKVKALNFVVKHGDRWFNNGGRDYHIRLKEPPKGLPAGEVGEIITSIIQREVEYGSWTLWHRIMECNSILNRRQDRDTLAVLAIWMRYSYLRKLDWQRNYNTRPRELTHEQKNLTFTITRFLAGASTEEMVSPAFLLRVLLSTLGKGGDHGQQIRDEILHIMHRNGLKEEYGTFYEQWH